MNWKSLRFAVVSLVFGLASTSVADDPAWRVTASPAKAQTQPSVPQGIQTKTLSWKAVDASEFPFQAPIEEVTWKLIPGSEVQWRATPQSHSNRVPNQEPILPFWKAVPRQQKENNPPPASTMSRTNPISQRDERVDLARSERLQMPGFSFPNNEAATLPSSRLTDIPVVITLPASRDVGSNETTLTRPAAELGRGLRPVAIATPARLPSELLP